MHFDHLAFKAARADRLLSVIDASRLSGVAAKTIRRLEAGEAEPRPLTLRRLLGALRLDKDEAMALGIIRP
jgi:transcriptional regulator with XRE-family HTH domain